MKTIIMELSIKKMTIKHKVIKSRYFAKHIFNFIKYVPYLNFRKETYSTRILKSYDVGSKGFWRWCITLRITGFWDFSRRPLF
jgi:hypothetical protein